MMNGSNLEAKDGVPKNTTAATPKKVGWKKKLVDSLSKGLNQQKTETIRKLLDVADKAVTEIEMKRVAEAITECMCRESYSELKSIETLLADNEGKAGLQRHRSHVSSQVVKYRVEKGWTQQQLAEKSGLPQSHISRIERCQLAPTQLTIGRLASAFGIKKEMLDPGFAHEDG